MPDSIFWEGLTELEAALTEQAIAAEAATTQAQMEAAHAAQQRMRERAGSGGQHAKGTPTPASPGGGPAVISGALVDSIEIGPLTPAGVQVGPTAIYGRRVQLSYGYRFTEPALEEVMPLLPAIYARNWASVIH